MLYHIFNVGDILNPLRVNGLFASGPKSYDGLSEGSLVRSWISVYRSSGTRDCALEDNERSRYEAQRIRSPILLYAPPLRGRDLFSSFDLREDLFSKVYQVKVSREETGQDPSRPVRPKPSVMPRLDQEQCLSFHSRSIASDRKIR